MNQDVRSRWLQWSSQFEGRVYCMYQDIRGLVTTGVGNLIDPVEYALVLPWQKPDGQTASQDEIAAEWRKVKADASLAQRGYHAAEQVTKLRLSGPAVDALVLGKLEANDKVLAARFAGWGSMPWQAQMVTHSLAWAMGPAFNFPKYKAALERADWPTAAAESYIPDANNPGLVPRNAADKALLLSLAGAPQAPPVRPQPVEQAPASPTPPPTVPAPTAQPRGFWNTLAAMVMRWFSKREYGR